MKIVKKIKSTMEQMTRSERRVASYFLEHMNDFAFETLDGIAEKMDVSTTSVIRFCRKIGFDGYKSFQNTVRSDFKTELALPDKLERTTREHSSDAQLTGTIQNAILCIKETFKRMPLSFMRNAVERTCEADRVFCFGLRESYALAHYAYTRLLTVRDNVYMLSAGQTGEIESILSLKPGDVCICYLFHRYTKQSPKILELIKKQGATVILITSAPYDSIMDFSDILLPCRVDIGGIKNSAVAPVCITDYLCNALALAGGEKSRSYMQDSELLFQDFTF